MSKPNHILKCNISETNLKPNHTQNQKRNFSKSTLKPNHIPKPNLSKTNT